MIRPTIESIGADWLLEELAGFTAQIELVLPSEFSEQNRYLPESVTSIPGPMSWDVNPFMKEIVDCFDVDSPVREVSLMKGVQITYTTLLESGLLYLIAHVRTVPCMFMTADKELAQARVENNIIPMINQSGFADVIRSSDETNKRKTGKTANHVQWAGGGYLVPFGAKNADKMRSFSIMVMLKDEIDAWPDTVGKDGDPDKLSDDRCKGYWERRKIFRGSAPLIKGSSKIYKAYLKGDQRKYMVRCVSCGYPQELRWSGKNADTGEPFGMAWELERGTLVQESVRYLCANCGHGHHEHDKEKLYSPEHGAEWKPTAAPAAPNIRSYHLPSLYSPIGMAPWYSLVSLYLEAYDPVEKRVRDIGAYQVFYNNVLAEPFEVRGSKIKFVAVSAHRRSAYVLGQIPNKYAIQYSGGPILFLTCQVDVHKGFLAVAVMGWTVGFRCYLVDYIMLYDDTENGCAAPESPVWGAVREILEEKVYISDDGVEYRIEITVIDAGYANATVVDFCADYESGVYPIVGREKLAREFQEITTQLGTVGYKVHVDNYKDRLAPVLRREWHEEQGTQKEYHFNAPIDLPDKALKELTKETRREKTNERGVVSYEWYRPGNARNELWDLLVYGHAAVEMMAWGICVKEYELDKTDMKQFWAYFS